MLAPPAAVRAAVLLAAAVQPVELQAVGVRAPARPAATLATVSAQATAAKATRSHEGDGAEEEDGADDDEGLCVVRGRGQAESDVSVKMSPTARL